MTDRLFETIERLHAPHPWGDVLDAGTGQHSLRWISTLSTRSWTAVTGDDRRATTLRRTLVDRIRTGDQILSGNWTDPALLTGRRFDVVIADYLLGAIDGFAPYYQDRLFQRLRPHVKGWLYVVGLAPYPEATDEAGRLVWEIARLRDACILLAGHRCYREYPADWVERSLTRSGYRVEAIEVLPIRYGARFINGQLDVCLRKLPCFSDAALADATRAHVEALRARALAFAEDRGALRFGEDYVVAARPDDGWSAPAVKRGRFGRAT
jgi:hypothetical protein